MNPLWTRIHRFIWSTMIQVISDHWSWSGSSQRNAPITFFPFAFSACNWAIDCLSRDWSFETSKDHRASWSRFFTSAKNGQVSQIWIRQLYRLIPKGPTIWLLRGRRGDLLWLRIFFLQTPEHKFFPDKRRCKIFSRIISHTYFFSVGNSFRQVFPCKNFFPSKSFCRIFFSEITYNPHSPSLKWSAPKN